MYETKSRFTPLSTAFVLISIVYGHEENQEDRQNKQSVFGFVSSFHSLSLLSLDLLPNDECADFFLDRENKRNQNKTSNRSF